MIKISNVLLAFAIGGIVAASSAVLNSTGPWGVTSAQAQQPEAPAFQPFPNAQPASSITASHLDTEVVIADTVKRVVASTGERVPYRVILEEHPTGRTIMVVYWPDTAPQIHRGQGAPQPGTRLSVRGTLEEFQNSFQVRVRNVAQVRIEGYPHTLGGTAAPAAPAAPAAGPPQPGPDGYFTVSQVPQLAQHYMLTDLSLKGTVSAFRERWTDTAPNVITMREGGQSIDLVYWSEIPGPFTEIGTPVYATGKIQDYQGRLQFRIEDLANLRPQPLPSERVVSPTPRRPPATEPAERWPWAEERDGLPQVERVTLPEGTELKLNEISPAHLGNTIQASGSVLAIRAEEDADLVVIMGDGAMLTLRLPMNASEKLSLRKEVTARGRLEFNQARSQPELHVPSANAIAIKE